MTPATKATDIKRNWHHIDVKDKTLGRVATEIAQLLIGKSKAYFVKNLDCGDYVVVTNASEVAVTGKKEEKKFYTRHSMYPGGYKTETLKELRSRRPEEVVRKAVSGMLPSNKLKATMLKRLYIFAGEEHDYKDKLTEKVQS